MARRIAIVGSRSICNENYTSEERAKAEKDWMFYHVDKLVGHADPETYDPSRLAILSGGAVGVDRAAEEYAHLYRIPFFLYKPYHLVDGSVEYSPRYFFTRNKQIVDNCDELIVFWDGESNGTADIMRFAGKRGKPAVVIKPNEDEISEFTE